MEYSRGFHILINSRILDKEMAQIEMKRVIQSLQEILTIQEVGRVYKHNHTIHINLLNSVNKILKETSALKLCYL